MYAPMHELTMSHYISPNLINHPPKLFCQLAGCNIPIPLEPYPPPFSLLLAASAELAPSERDVRRFFCSEEHRDQCWKTEKGWFDRRVAMPSVSLSWPRSGGDADDGGESSEWPNRLEIASIEPSCVSSSRVGSAWIAISSSVGSIWTANTSLDPCVEWWTFEPESKTKSIGGGRSSGLGAGLWMVCSPQ
jgi:hypothetical protein